MGKRNEVIKERRSLYTAMLNWRFCVQLAAFSGKSVEERLARMHLLNLESVHPGAILTAESVP